MSDAPSQSFLNLLNPFAIVANLWKQRELLWQFTLRNVELRHKGSHLGLIWSVLNPLLMLSLYVYVFSFIFGGSFGVIPNETRLEYGLGVFIGLSFFQFLAEMLGAAPTYIVTNPNFVKKVVFPLELLPAAGVGAAAIHMLISLGLILIGVVFFGPGLHAGLLWLPVIILPLVLLCLGCAWFLAALGVFLRDTGQVIQFVSTVLMWSSAVFYSPYKFKSAWVIVRFNPLLLAIEEGRQAVLWHGALHPIHLAYLYVSSLLVFVFGYAVFARLKPTFADVL